jgi:hypothetical protein
VGIFQCNPIQSAISQNLIGQNFATELEYIGKCPQWLLLGLQLQSRSQTHHPIGLSYGIIFRRPWIFGCFGFVGSHAGLEGMLVQKVNRKKARCKKPSIIDHLISKHTISIQY